MKLLQATLMVSVCVMGASRSPALQAARALTQISKSSVSSEKQLSLTRPTVSPSVQKAAPPPPPPPLTKTNFVYERKVRIQRVLLALDRVAAATLQMKPEMASRLEPVVVDLAEQAVDLSSDEALRLPDTDANLTKLEETVLHLIETMSRVVEPEILL